jgi:hypothetical protein
MHANAIAFRETCACTDCRRFRYLNAPNEKGDGCITCHDPQRLFGTTQNAKARSQLRKHISQSSVADGGLPHADPELARRAWRRDPQHLATVGKRIPPRSFYVFVLPRLPTKAGRALHRTQYHVRPSSCRTSTGGASARPATVRLDWQVGAHGTFVVFLRLGAARKYLS